VLSLLILSVVPNVFAADHYIRDGATGDGSDWANAWDSLPANLVRGDMYYIADGTYSEYTFDDAESGSQYIYIKKATVDEHGTDTGWQNGFGNGQAVFDNHIVFASSYYNFDGNGAHVIPSDDTNDYGFKISADYGVCPLTPTGTAGILRFGTATGPVSNIIVKYTHVYNSHNGNDGNVCAVGVRFFPGYSSSYIKIQNSFIENSGKDGVQISASNHIVIERTYLKKLALAFSQNGPDCHGQTIQLFYGGDDIIFRYNIFEANQGQSLLAVAGINSASLRIRFYGNVVFNKYGEQSTATYGYNVGGGVMGDAWNYNGQ